MILIIKTNKERLHDYEYVKPIEDIIQQTNTVYQTKHYQDLTAEDLEQAEKIIICGTSIQDNQYLEDKKKFSWIPEYQKPLLGICAGMQLLLLAYGGKQQPGEELGYYHEYFEKPYLGLQGELEVYHLHENSVIPSPDFEVYCASKYIQAIKHQNKKHYGVLFHPEVRNKQLITNFIQQ